jgi:hypothetical protein
MCVAHLKVELILSHFAQVLLPWGQLETLFENPNISILRLTSLQQ